MEKTKEFLSEATRLVGKDREEDYGDKVHNHSNIARLWSAYLDTKIEGTKLGKVSKDTYIDMAANGAIAGEIKFKESKKESKGERRGRETLKYINSLNKVNKGEEDGK